MRSIIYYLTLRHLETTALNWSRLRLRGRYTTIHRLDFYSYDIERKRDPIRVRKRDRFRIPESKTYTRTVMETSRWDDPCPGTVGLGSPQKSPVSRLTDCLYTTRRPNPLITLYYNRLWRSEKTTGQTDTMEQNDADYPLVVEGGRRSVTKRGTSDRPTDRAACRAFSPIPFPFPVRTWTHAPIEIDSTGRWRR